MILDRFLLRSKGQQDAKGTQRALLGNKDRLKEGK